MNTPQPNNNVDPYSLKPTAQQPGEVDRASGSVRRRKIWPLLLIIFSALGLLAGILVGVIYFSQCPKVYESRATVTIQPREKQLSPPSHYTGDFGIRHDQLIDQDNILMKCLIKYCLQDLETLRDFPATEQVKEIQDNLVVSQNPDEPTQYFLEYSSLNPRDAQTVLATVIATYEKHLVEKYRSRVYDPKELWKKMSDKFHVEIKAINKQLKEARDRAEEFAIAGHLKHIQPLIAELRKKIDLEKGQLAELSADLQRSEAALKNGQEACLEQIWILEEAGKISSNSLRAKDVSQELSFEMKLIEDLESQSDKLDADNDKSGRQALNLVIGARKEKVKELSSVDAKILEVRPEKILQRFVVSVKQKIDDLRLTLQTDLESYRDNYEKSVKAERALKEVDELEADREKMVKNRDVADTQFFEDSGSVRNLHKGFIFETTQPAYRGLEVWPVLPEIIATSGLIGLLLGLGLGGFVVLVSKAFSLARA